MILGFLSMFLWFGCGIYGMGVNTERTRRIYGKMSGWQNLCTYLLGPIGLYLVMVTGGRWKYWETEG